MKISEFSYELPAELIAQEPLADRAGSRMLEVPRGGGGLRDGRFAEFAERLEGNELVVLNDARVIPARLLGKRKGLKSERVSARSRIRGEQQGKYLGAEIEIFLLRPMSDAETNIWEVLVRPGRKVRVGERVVFGGGELEAEVLDRGEYGKRTVRFTCEGGFREAVEKVGHVPLPPYIHRGDGQDDRARYQTVFAKRWGAVAAPTAGLHFTGEVLRAIRARGCEIAELTLEVGYGTFQPIHSETVEGHRMHSERFEVSEAVADMVNRAKSERRPVLAVGTTVVRALESAADETGVVASGAGETQLFISPGYEFQVVDQLLTNFHLPESSLLILVCGFSGTGNVLAAYAHAVEQRYRFYSYGDCMLIR